MGKVLIVGATGYLGKELFASIGKVFDTQGTSTMPNPELIHLNLGDPDYFPYASIVSAGDVVVITAAISAPDICANEYEYAWGINVKGTSFFIKNIINMGARVIFLSSDTVYGEHERPFDERCALRPAGEYAQMKYEIEKIFRESQSFKSIRLSYVFSREDKFTKYLIGCMKRSEEAEIFHPFCRSVIYRGDVVDGVIALIKNWDEVHHSFINFGGPETVSRVDFKEIFSKNFVKKIQSRVIEPPSSFFLNRPRIIAMKSPVLGALLGRQARSLNEAMKVEFTNDWKFENFKHEGD
jgi:dTDP-4-dehydrorhamnose reductase